MFRNEKLQVLRRTEERKGLNIGKVGKIQDKNGMIIKN